MITKLWRWFIPAQKKWDEKIHRFDGQYLQTLASLWTNINSLIWQQLVFVLTVQSAAILAMYATRHSWLSISIGPMLIVFTIGFTLHIYRNMRFRQRLVEQANYVGLDIVDTIPLSRRPRPSGLGMLHDYEADRKFPLLRHGSGLLVAFFVIVSIDILVTATFNMPDYMCRTWFGSSCREIRFSDIHIIPGELSEIRSDDPGSNDVSQPVHCNGAPSAQQPHGAGHALETTETTAGPEAGK